LFAINELPDLAPRIQVGLFNVLEERDVQIRGYPIRLDLDVAPVDQVDREVRAQPAVDRALEELAVGARPRHGLRGGHGGARSACQLDGERQTVQGATELRDRQRVVIIEGEVGVVALCPLDEQLNCIGGGNRVGPVVARRPERRYREQHLADNTEGFSAGGEDADIGWCGPDDSLAHRGD